MQTFSRFIITTFSGVLFSLLLWEFLIFCLLIASFFSSSGGFIQLFPSGDADWSPTIKWAAIIGMIQGLTIGISIFFVQPVNTLRSGLTGFITTEILLLTAIVGFVIYVLLPRRTPAKVPEIHLLLVGAVRLFLIISTILLVPSVLIGVITGKLQGMIDSNIEMSLR